MDYLLAGSLGGLVALMFSIPAVLLEFIEHRSSHKHVSDSPLIVDVKTIFGIKLKKESIFLVGLLLHVLFGFAFGVVYVLFVKMDWLFVTHSPYTFLSLLVFAVLSWLVAGFVLYPLLGMRLFGIKEGRYVWAETITSHLILGVTLWILIQYYQPQFFTF